MLCQLKKNRFQSKCRTNNQLEFRVKDCEIEKKMGTFNLKKREGVMVEKKVAKDHKLFKQLNQSIRQDILEQFEVEDELIYLIEDGFHSYNEALHNLVKR